MPVRTKYLEVDSYSHREISFCMDSSINYYQCNWLGISDFTPMAKD